jgi:S-adenosylmethionine-diacylglycerol 3-amino-3-carboxypropyl transferase
MQELKIYYSQCWEDADILVKALNISQEDDVLSITSGGDNTLALLLQKPKTLTAIDINPAQNYLLELKIAAIKGLGYNSFLEFIGVKQSNKRLETFQNIKGSLSEEASQWWSQRTNLIEKGIIHIGKLENYFRLFKKLVLPIIHSEKTTAELFELNSLQDQKDFYINKWDNWRLRLLVKLFFSKAVMSRVGRSKDAFRYATTGNLGQHYLAKTKQVITNIPIEANYYLDYILHGTYSNQERMPTYMQEKYYQTLREEVDKIKIITKDINDFLSNSLENTFSKFNLSDIFESMSVDQTERVQGNIARAGRTNGVIVFWNNLVSRKSSNANIREDTETAKRLSLLDRSSFLYSNFIIESIEK